MENDERLRAARGMMQWGGKFIVCLGYTLENADDANAEKIKATWPDEWAKYAKIGEADETNENGV